MASMPLSSYTNELAKIVAFKGLSSQLACAECNRCTHCLREDLVQKIGNERSVAANEHSSASNERHMSVTTQGTVSIMTPINDSSCCCVDRVLPKPPISGCGTCTRVLQHHSAPLFQKIDELFGPSTPGAQSSILGPIGPQSYHGEADDAAEWQFVNKPQTFHERLAQVNAISRQEMFLRGSEGNGPWVLGNGSKLRTKKTSTRTGI